MLKQLLPAFVLLIGSAAHAQFAITSEVISAGGGPLSGATYTSNGTTGQPVVGMDTSASYELSSGFWFTFWPGNEDTCPCEFNDTDPVDVGDLLAFLAGWFGSQGPATPGDPLDQNNDGTIDVGDLLTFLGCWFPVTNGAACP